MRKRTLVVALVAVSLGAHAAGTLYTLANEAGGEIRLTDSVGPCTGETMHAYATTAKGAMTTGCWFYTKADDLVTIEWRGGATVKIEAVRLAPTAYLRELRAAAIK